MTPDLAGEIVRILDGERGYPALSVDSIRAVLKAAAGVYLADGELELALAQLLHDGRIECVRSKSGERYRVLRDDRADVNEGEPAA